MTLDEGALLRLLHSTEHTFAERKTVGDSRDWVKTVVAFANTLDPSQEGVLFIGATDEGVIEASNPNLDKLQRTFSEKIQSIYPNVYYSTGIVREDNRECLAVIIPGSPSKPHFAGPLYLRDGSQSIVAKAEQYDSILAARTSKVRELQRWINQPITIRTFSRRTSTAFQLDQRDEEAKLISCNQFYLTVFYRNNHWSYPLSRIEIAYDHRNERLELEIIPPSL